MCPLYRQNEGAYKDKGGGGHILGIVDTTESSELIEVSFHKSKMGLDDHVTAHLAYKHMS